MEFNKTKETLDKNNQEVLEIFGQLPQVIQRAITESGWENTLRVLVDEYGLRIDQGTVLENMTFGIMLGMVEPEEYYETILKEFELDTSTANSLFTDIDEKIFSNIQNIIISLDQTDVPKEVSPDRPRTQFPTEESLVDDNVPSRDEVMKGIEDSPEEFDRQASVIRQTERTEAPANLPTDGGIPPVKTEAVEININRSNYSPPTIAPVPTPTPVSVPIPEPTPVVQTPPPVPPTPPIPQIPQSNGNVPPPPPKISPNIEMDRQSAPVMNSQQVAHSPGTFSPDSTITNSGNSINIKAYPSRNANTGSDPYREPIN